MRHGLIRLLLAPLVLLVAVLALWQLRSDPHRSAQSGSVASKSTGAVEEPAVEEPQPGWLPHATPPRVRVRPGTPAPAVAMNSSGEDERQQLRDAGVTPDGPGALALFRRRTLTDDERQRIAGLVKHLGDDAFAVRRKTAAELVHMGSKALPQLATVLRDPDPEVRRRAEECLRQIGIHDVSPDALCAAARLVAAEKPADAATVLIAYLPFATSSSVAEELRASLAAVAVREGRAVPALVAALKDPEPVRRAAAAEALCSADARGEFPKVQKLLEDPVASVRLQTGLSLARVGEKAAFPVLIALLDEVPAVDAWQAEYLLRHLAKDSRPPRKQKGNDAETRQKRREAWAAWWKAHGDEADLTRLRGLPHERGRTMVVLLDAGRVQEVDAAGDVIWSVSGLHWPLDAQLLTGDRVLVAESQGNRVTERNFQGAVLWEKRIDNPLMAQRLRNGNTFIASMGQMIEVDRGGKEVFSLAVEGASIRKAVKLPNGDVACVTSRQRFVRYDASGKELQNFPAVIQHFGGRLEVLPHGHVLLPQVQENSLIECDADGREVWQINLNSPIAAVRLPNGNTLVTFMQESRVVEIDAEGKEVWEYKTDTRLTRAWRR